MARNYTINEKIADFEEAVRIHILDAAQVLLDHVPAFSLAAVRLMAAYFEIIAKYKDGFAATGKSKEYFVRGCRDIIDRLPQARRQRAQTSVEDRHLETFYELVRCSLFHGAVPSLRVQLGSSMYGLVVSDDGRLTIDPSNLLPVLRRHFDEYIRKLRDESERDIRNNFEKRWDFEASFEVRA